MAHVNRRIGKSSETANNTADGTGGGVLDAFIHDYFNRSGNVPASPGKALLGLTATGGVINDYAQSGIVYRAHIFTSAGDFNVTTLGDFGDTVDALLVGGGGGGGNYGGGGGGGAVVHVEGKPISTGPNTVVIASGGVGAGPDQQSVPVPSARDGGSTTFLGYTATGGGGAGGYNDQPARGGANGGGQGAYLTSGVAGTAPTQPSPLSPYSSVYAGNTGGVHGASSPPYGYYPSGGGAGAGGDGNSVPAPSNPEGNGGAGGVGKQINIIPSPPSINSGNGYHWAGGGGGSIYNPLYGNGGAGGIGGGGGGGDSGAGGGSALTSGESADPNGRGGDGGASTGGGGGGAAYYPNGAYRAGNGAGGIVIVRYTIGTVQTGDAKATGGAISFYGGKTIHTFIGSGTFTAPGSFSETCEYVVLGGGASGGACGPSQGGGGGGGGAGSYRTGTTPISGPSTTTIQVGAGGASPSTPGNNHGTVGTPSFFGAPITAPTGGYGAMADGSPKTGGGPGGSGGGGGGGGGTGNNANAGPSTGADFPGTIGSSPTAGWGHDGGAGVSGGQGYSGGGGGGAGGGGVAGTYGTDGKGGNGGLGIQLPSSFRNPTSTVGYPGPTSPSVTGADTSGKYYVAGGGGGGINPLGGGTPEKGYGGVGPGTTTSRFAGAGDSGKDAPGSDADVNSGSGGGGTGGDSAGYSGNGGSGLVLIAYPT